jgi:hypothetical protein
MEAYALAELGERVAIRVFIQREDAFAALEAAALRDEPQWARVLFVAPIELDERDFSPN